MYWSSLMDAVYYFFIDLFRLEGLVRLSCTDKASIPYYLIRCVL